MDTIKNTLGKRSYNVNVVNNLDNNVNNDIVEKIRDAIDKPKAIGEDLAEKLNSPQNLKFYIKLAYQYPTETLYECLALTNEAQREGIIKTTSAQYFYGIVRRKKRL